MRIRTLTAALILASLTLVPQCATPRRAPSTENDAMAPSPETDAMAPSTETDAMPPSTETDATAPAEAHATTSMEADSMAPSAAASAAPIPTPSAADAADPFRGSVRPVLSTRCAPCHEPGGKMYARMPFDDAKVVSSNSAGILRRLKGDDRAALEKWLAGSGAAGGVAAPK